MNIVTLRLFLLTLALGLLGPTLYAAKSIWVQPTGDDKNEGSQERPFATLQRATIELRELVKQGLADDVVIRLRGGVYQLDRPIELTPAELGDGRYRIIFTSVPGEKAVLVGSRPLPKEWRQTDDATLWQLDLSEARQQRWVFRSLFLSGTSQPRAREPDEGFFTVADVQDERRRIVLQQRLPEAWKDLNGVEINTTAHWHFNRQPAAEITDNAVVGYRGIGTDVSSSRITPKSHSRVWLENAQLFADTPGEWFLDTAAGSLFYRGKPGEDPNRADFSAPVSRELIVVQGSAEQAVRNLHFRGLEFAETDWEMPEEGRLGVQAGAWAFDRSRTFSPGAAVRFLYAEDISVEDCTFRDLGDGAISLEAGTHRALISRCDFLRVGSNAVQIGRIPAYTGIGHPMHADFADSRMLVDETGIIPSAQMMWERSQKTTPEAPSQVTITDNTFVDCGHLDYGSVAVCVTYANHTTIEHNLFRNLPYSAINVGWRWAPGLSNCHSNQIRRNRIDGVMRLVGDGAGVYLVGEQPGTSVVENYITGSGGNYWAHGIYADEFSDHMEIADNYVADVMDYSIFMHKNGPNQHVHGNNGVLGPNPITGQTARGTRWIAFSPIRTPSHPETYGPRR